MADSISAKTSFPALMASLGFMGRSGFILGADLGLLFPLGSLRMRMADDTGTLSQSGISQADMDAARTKAEAILLPAPAPAGSTAAAGAYLRDPYVAAAMAKARGENLAFVGIGASTMESVMVPEFLRRPRGAACCR